MCVCVLLLVMGHVVNNGLTLLGTGTNIWKNKELKCSIEEMVKLAEKNSITAREKKHVDAIKNWAEG